jgi:eukaryotic-like serine/threonine-protein kinase
VVEPDTIIDGRYRVLSRLGSGGMADVYLAEDQLLGRRLAVKVLHHHFAEDQEFVERFRREASAAARLSHPNIVGIFDRGEWNGTYYIAMEYVPGSPLKTLVREHGPLEPAVAIDIVAQILQAARFAHAHGVIHRDLKPHNVILDEEGRARVTDFGIAQAGASEMTMTGSIMGTAQYLSPEQAQGHAVSATSDLYSIGVILYELLTGIVPFDGDTAVAIAFKQVSAQPIPPSSANPAVPPALDVVVLRALAKDPSQRYANADEFVAALQSVRGSLPEAATTAAFATPVPMTATEQSTASHGAVPAGVALSTGARPPALLLPPDGSPPLGPPGAPRNEPEPRASRRRRRRRWAIVAIVVGAAVAAALLVGLTRSPSTPTVRVPKVIGQTEAAASETLHRAGLVPVPALTPSSTVAAGTVLAQTPRADSLVSKNTHVTISVSTGSAPLPSVVGFTAARAIAKLKAAGFKPTPQSRSSSTVPSGHVISTDPTAGTELQGGSAVTVYVSSGPVQIKVPHLVGEPRSVAEAALIKAKLSVGTITHQETSSQPPGTVLAQSPAAGESLPSEGAVDLTVARAPREAVVPNVEGAAQAAASAALRHAEFKVQTISGVTTEKSQDGVVLAQSPAAGSRARKGTTVTITIGVLAPQTTPTASTPTPSPPPAAGE